MTSTRREIRNRRQRPTKRAILLVTNGQVTERQYLSEVARRANSSTQQVTVKVIAKEPETMLKELRSPKGDVSGYDEIWLIFDEDGQDRSAVVQQCQKQSSARQTWSCVISRPCFEVWLIAHYAQVRNYVDQGDAQQHLAQLTHRSASEKRLPAHFPFDEFSRASSRCSLPGTPGGESRVGTDIPRLLMHLGVVAQLAD